MNATVGCTVVTEAGLGAARVLARSYLEHHPGHGFVVLVLDGTGPDGDGYRVVSPDWPGLDTDAFLRMATCGTPEELAGALAPLLVRRLLDDHDVVVTLAPSTLVLGPLPEFGDGLTLIPRVLAPVPDDGRQPKAVGGFDRGFVAVGRAAKAFVDFWAERADTALTETDATRPWSDEAPALFEHHVLRDPSVGVAAWNLHEREPDNVTTIDFTGYDRTRPWLASAEHDRPRTLLSERPEWRAHYERYAELLDAENHRPTALGFDFFPDGEPITDVMRDLYREAVRRTTEPNPLDRKVDEVPPHPFGDDRGTGFREWLSSPATPVERTGGLNRLLTGVWRSRVDLQVAFPQPNGQGFRDWCHRHGVSEGVPDWALPSRPAAVDPPTAELGVNVAGYHTAELGIGEMGRVMLSVVKAAGVPHVSVVEEHSVAHNVRTGMAAPDSVGRPRFPISFITVNGDNTPALLAADPEVGHGRYRIGLWAWELEDFPATMHHGFGLVDEVWTVSDFTRRAIAAHSPVPVKTVPVPVIDRGLVRHEPRTPGETTRFLFAFDYNSTAQRKNPWGVVTAFQRAFVNRDDVALVIKSTNAHLHGGAAERLRVMCADDPRITLVERYLSVEELADLYATSHAYVSLHRSEGFGLTVAEAMIRGLAVVSTDYASTTEFVDATVGWPIPHSMVEVGEGWPPYQPEASWADPDLDAAAQALREIADNPDEAHRRGLAAREHLLRTRSVEAAAAWMRTQLEAAHRAWRSGARPTAPEQEPLARAQDAVRSRPDVGGPTRLPFGRAARRVVGRAIGHYAEHQRGVLDTLAGAVREAVTRIEDRLEQSDRAQRRRVKALERVADRRLSAVEARLAELERRTRE